MQGDTAVPIDVVIPESHSDCLIPILAPTEPAVIPHEGGVDETTGRHMMGTPQVLKPESYRLAVTGLVDHPLRLRLDDLRCMPKITETVTTTCYNFQDTAMWSGVLISDVLKKAGVQSAAKKVIQTGADGASRTVTLDMTMDPHNFLAYEMERNPLPVLFGFPVRSIFINVAGMYSVKWLTSLKLI
jgi:DMSO/TMAO reductase YedYZ molybdopterin-dependent catalytic subunit